MLDHFVVPESSSHRREIWKVSESFSSAEPVLLFPNQSYNNSKQNRRDDDKFEFLLQLGEAIGIVIVLLLLKRAFYIYYLHANPN